MKRILAVLTGCIVGVVVIFLVESVSHLLYPIPANIDPNNMEQLKEIMAQAPAMSLIIVLLAYFLGSFIGGIIATIIIRSKDKTPALIVGLVLTGLGLMTLLSIPHPVWFTIISLFIYFAGSLSGYVLYSKLKKNV